MFCRYEETYEAHHHHPYPYDSHAVHRPPSYRYESVPAPEYQYHHPREPTYAPGNSNVQNAFFQNNVKTHTYKNNNNYKNHWSNEISGMNLNIQDANFIVQQRFGLSAQK